MTGDEFDDDRDRCHNPQDDPWLRGDAHLDLESVLAMSDARVKPELLHLLLPCLDCRWPEPRALAQDEVFFLPDRERLDVPRLSPREASLLLEFLDEIAEELWGAAARDEELTTSSGMRRALAAVGVPAVADHDPAVWVRSSRLARTLAGLAAGTGVSAGEGPGPP